MRINVQAIKVGNRTANASNREMFPAEVFTIHISNIATLEDCTTRACGKLPNRVPTTRIRTHRGGYFKVTHNSNDVLIAMAQAFLGGENAEAVTVAPSYTAESVTPSWTALEAEPYAAVLQLTEGDVVDEADAMVDDYYRSNW
jgi:hypothetical protein